MGKIDDLIAVNKAIATNNSIKEKIHRYHSLQYRIDSMQKDVDDIYDRIDNFKFSEGQDEELMEEASKIEESIEALNEELEELGDIELLQDMYEQDQGRLDQLLEATGIEEYEFNEAKTKYLQNLFFIEGHISTIGEDPETFFKKLIELYGEKELADFSCSFSEDEIEFDEDYDMDDADKITPYVYRISDFVSGYEDKIIDLVSNDTLRKELLASKLQNGQGDILKYLEEYNDEATRYGSEDYTILDDLGLVDAESTLKNFSILPISNDKNFYLCLATHLDEMQISLEKFMQYIDPNNINDEFRQEIVNASKTKQYEYKEDNFLFKKPINPQLLAWLEDKDKELSAEEAIAQQYSELEALQDELEEKKGKNVGE